MSFFPLGLTLGGSVALILLGVGLFIKTLRFRARAQPVSAEIVKIEETDDYREDGLMAYRLSYEYTASDGRVIQADSACLQLRSPQVGTSRTLLVDPEKPKSLQLPGIREYLVPLVLAITGIIVLFKTVILL